MVAAGLLARLTVTEVATDRFEGSAADMPPRMYGGEVAAQALVSANRTVGDDRLEHSVQCTHLVGGDPAVAVHYQVERLRDGRSFSTRAVTASQLGRPIFRAHIGYHVPETGVEHQVVMPGVPGPEGLPTLAQATDAEGKAWSDWQAQHPEYEMRPVPPDVEDPTGRRQFWCRFLFDGGDDLQRQGVLAVYSSDL